MSGRLKLILPKGCLQERVMRLMDRIGLSVEAAGRSLRPACEDPAVEVKILKPQNIPNLVALGRHDCGFTGHDWVVEQRARVEELLDLGFDPVRVVAAVPEEAARNGDWLGRPLVVASEYRNLAEDFIRRRRLDAVFLQSYGATEALPPEDADLIIDNTATGATLKSHRLAVVDEILRSTTRFVCNREALANPWKRRKTEELVMLMRSTLAARTRVLIEMNVPADRLECVVRDLPCMRSPTVAPLHGEEGFAVKVAVPAKDVPRLVPRLRAAGARDILEYRLEKIVV